MLQSPVTPSWRTKRDLDTHAECTRNESVRLAPPHEMLDNRGGEKKVESHHRRVVVSPVSPLLHQPHTQHSPPFLDYIAGNIRVVALSPVCKPLTVLDEHQQQHSLRPDDTWFQAVSRPDITQSNRRHSLHPKTSDGHFFPYFLIG
jgi:hypothetical protein